MMTYLIWKLVLEIILPFEWNDVTDAFVDISVLTLTTLVSHITLLIDIFIIPLELIVLIIYLIKEKLGWLDE